MRTVQGVLTFFLFPCFLFIFYFVLFLLPFFFSLFFLFPFSFCFFVATPMPFPFLPYKFISFCLFFASLLPLVCFSLASSLLHVVLLFGFSFQLFIVSVFVFLRFLAFFSYVFVFFAFSCIFRGGPVLPCPGRRRKGDGASAGAGATILGLPSLSEAWSQKEAKIGERLRCFAVSWCVVWALLQHINLVSAPDMLTHAPWHPTDLGPGRCDDTTLPLPTFFPRALYRHHRPRDPTVRGRSLLLH